VLFDEGLLPEPAVAETLLDLGALQDIGVHLVIGVLGGDAADLADWAMELEIKFARIAAGPEDAEACAAECAGVLKRGQAALLDCGKLDPLGPELAAVGRGVAAAKLISLVNGPGVMRGGAPLHAVPSSAVAVLEGEIEGRAMLAAAAAVCEGGIPRVHILDGRQQGVLADELFSNEGVGTMVHADSYKEVRDLREEDIPELLAMIGRSVRRAHLVPRDYDEIVERRPDFLVLSVDDNVVGCVAVHSYAGNVGEVACLYVKQSHEHSGYGKSLVRAAERKAVTNGLKRIFALTNRAADFFAGLGYAATTMDRVPELRRKKLEESCRASVVLEKEV
jgi:amino-acid N-acetyltransferase